MKCFDHARGEARAIVNAACALPYLQGYIGFIARLTINNPQLLLRLFHQQLVIGPKMIAVSFLSIETLFDQK